MICTVCREAHTTQSLTSIQFERDEFRAMVHKIPAWVCPACGESYLEEGVAADVLKQVREVMAEGELDVALEYL
ncbi:MAG: YgiT-type zinc finger protein [Anaerolineales bacterium]|nr:YgiT-type zinc finger protein [Anaerolineales bacterium]MCB9145907.1 YgiT-type zinc finger protein [Anaerolineales bacterium]